MNNENEKKIPDYITFPRTFENYKWYKPLLVLIIGVIIYQILQLAIFGVFTETFGPTMAISVFGAGYETMNTSDAAAIISFLSVGMLIPSLYIASKIVRDRPFSSYSSSRGGWNWKIYFKCLIIPIVVYGVYSIILAIHNGKVATTQISIISLLAVLILVPFQCIGEEYVFRGLFMQTLGSWFNMPVLGLILQTILFVSLHPYNILGMASIFITGLFYGLLTWKTNGLEAGSAAHSINNLSTFYMVALGFDSLSKEVSFNNFIISAVLLIVSTFLIYYIGNKYGWFNEQTNS